MGLSAACKFFRISCNAAVVRAGARRRLIKWAVFFHFRRRRRPKSDDFVLLGLHGL